MPRGTRVISRKSAQLMHKTITITITELEKQQALWSNENNARMIAYHQGQLDLLEILGLSPEEANQ